MLRIISLLLVCACFSAGVAAQDYSKIKSVVKSIIPNVENIAVSETPIQGVLQVEADYQVFYMDQNGDYLVQGDIIDLSQRKSLTDLAKNDIRRKLLTEINRAEQISFAPEETQYDVVVFTDVDCGYCRRLHQQIEQYNEQGIAVHYMLYPRAGIPSNTYDKLVSVWCASDQKAALTAAKQGQTITQRDCETPIADQYEMGKKMGLTGTPAIVASDGTLIPGYVEPQDLRRRLDAILLKN